MRTASVHGDPDVYCAINARICIKSVSGRCLPVLHQRMSIICCAMSWCQLFLSSHSMDAVEDAWALLQVNIGLIIFIEIVKTWLEPASYHIKYRAYVMTRFSYSWNYIHFFLLICELYLTETISNWKIKL